MSQSAHYDILLSGALNQDKTDVISALSILFKKSEQQVEALLSKAPVVVKKSVDEATAQQYKKAIEQRGAEVILEPIKSALHDSWSLEPTDEEAEKSVTGKASYVAKDIESDFQAVPQRPSTDDDEQDTASSSHTSLPDDDELAQNDMPESEALEAPAPGWKSKIKGLFNKDS